MQAREVMSRKSSDDDVDSEGDSGVSPEGSDDEQDERISQGQCTWSIEAAASVYNDGMYRIVTADKLFKSKGCLMFGCNMIAVLLLLSFNLTLQLVVMSRVRFLVHHAMEDSKGSVFWEEGGGCIRRAPGEMPIVSQLPPEPFYWDCGPLFPALMSNVSFVDVNGDGNWSMADDPNGLTIRTRKTWTKTGNFTRILQSFMRWAKDGKFLSQENISKKEWKSLTNGWTSIPMQWLRKEQGVIHLCMNTDGEMCGNLERRGVLNYTLDYANMSGADRIPICRKNVDRCQSIYGELYRSYMLFQDQVCGGHMYFWDPTDRINIGRRGVAYKYDAKGNDSAITDDVYQVFLALVLVIWWLVVVEEARSVINWWMVTIFIPCNAKEGQEDVEETEEKIKINTMGVCAKVCMIMLIMIPRTIIVMGFAWTGSLFLIVADGWTDLILNSTALAFLIEVDDMMFASFCSQNTKQRMEKMEPIEGTPGFCHFLAPCCNMPTSVPIVVMVTAIVSGFIYVAFMEPGGKNEVADAFRCLCHGEGPRCITAQILGGNPVLPPQFYS